MSIRVEEPLDQVAGAIEIWAEARNAAYRPTLPKRDAMNLRRKRMDICEHMEVVDANGQHVGIVEKVEGDRIKLIKSDALDPQHLFLDKSQVAGVEDNKVKLSQKVSAITTRAFLSRNT
jgi:hypothetical protein